jgi:hypothetical protein
MKPALLFLLVFLTFSACEKNDPAAQAALEGTYVAQIDPLRCAMPTTSTLSISPEGGGTYRIDYDFFWKPGYSLTGVDVKRVGEAYRLSYRGESIGQFGPDEVLDPKTFKRIPGRLLVLRWEKSAQERLEFMGVKK